MSRVEQSSRHYFLQHALRAQPPEAMNAALRDAIARLQASLSGPAPSESTRKRTPEGSQFAPVTESNPGSFDGS